MRGKGASMKCVNIRLASLIGPSGSVPVNVLYKFLQSGLEGKDFCVVGGRQQFSFLDVRDAAEAILRLVESDVDKWETIYNLGPRFGPGVGGIFRHIDGHIAKQGDALLIYIFAQRAPLAEKQPLAVAVEIGVLLEGRGVHAAEILIFAGPLCPHIAAAGFLDGGVKGVSVQPVDGAFAVRGANSARDKIVIRNSETSFFMGFPPCDEIK